MSYDAIKDILISAGMKQQGTRKRLFAANPDSIKKFEDQVFLKTKVSGKNTSTGISMYAEADYQIFQTIERSNKEIEKLGEQMRTTLEGLNSFLTVTKQAIVTYCSNPTFENYEKMKSHFESSSQFQWEKLTQC